MELAFLIKQLKPSPWRYSPAKHHVPFSVTVKPVHGRLCDGSYITFNLKLANKWLAKYN